MALTWPFRGFENLSPIETTVLFYGCNLLNAILVQNQRCSRGSLPGFTVFEHVEWFFWAILAP
jgi:hypothetical protein